MGEAANTWSSRANRAFYPKHSHTQTQHCYAQLQMHSHTNGAGSNLDFSILLEYTVHLSGARDQTANLLISG